jgi:hypothetical protein
MPSMRHEAFVATLDEIFRRFREAGVFATDALSPSRSACWVVPAG